jgi:hypothetical protein
MINDAIRVIRKFVCAIDDLAIPYYIGGSIASIVYGKARTTRDVDFVLTVRDADAQRLVERLDSEFHIDLVAVQRSISTGDCFNALELEAIFQADVFTPRPTPWIEEQFARRQLHRLGAGNQFVEVYLCSPEDVILNKLEWFRLGNEVSRLQWEDAVGVLTVQTQRLDNGYLDRWAEQLKLQELLSLARASVGDNLI